MNEGSETPPFPASGGVLGVELWPCCNTQDFLCGSRAGARISAQAERTLTFATRLPKLKPRPLSGAFSLQRARHATRRPLSFGRVLDLRPGNATVSQNW
jgi:hypothetical protein